MSMPVSERRRVREVRRYYDRSADDTPIAGVQSTAVSSPNTTLTALVQLIAWRLGMQRAIVSVVDENAQYFLAESTKTLNLIDSSQHDAGDALWMGCGGTIRTEALCANTIELQCKPGEFACFSVEDLSKDERFCNLPYVAGSPNFRFYAGTPLISRAGIPIGSVFVIDDRPHRRPTKSEVEFLGIMARNVMEYLETRRENEIKERIDVMSRGLAALVDGKSKIPLLGEGSLVSLQDGSLSQSKQTSQPDQPGLRDGQESHLSPPEDPLSRNVLLSRSMSSPMKSDDSSSSETSSLKALPIASAEESIPVDERLFSRASNILQEALDVDYTVFFDVRVGNSTPLDEVIVSATPIQDEIIAHENSETKWPTSSTTDTPISPFIEGSALPTPEQQWGDATATAATTAGRQASRLNLANILAFSAERPPLFEPHQSRCAPPLFNAPEQRRLRRLIKRYPTGKIWTLDDHDAESTGEEDLLNLSPPPSAYLDPSSSRTHMTEVAFLMSCFPGVKQVLFAPLWEAGRAKHIAACFAVSLGPVPVFTTDTETTYSQAFMNSISIAYSLASLVTANKQKDDFISSVSHELRSPLHGVIASVELLAGSNLDKQQKELCDTIATCGQVLLETISDILEYTKINSLRKDARGLARISRKNSLDIPLGVRINEESMLLRMMAEESKSLISDVARLCEDAVGVVAAAHVLAMLNSEEHLHRIYSLPGATTIINGQVTMTRKQSVPIILDISQADWGFVCLSGAFQRIVMNLVGNSLKYTKSGFIQIQLSIKPATDDGEKGKQQDIAKREVVLVVRDSGKGISSDFLKNKLFSPFTQESVLAPGTGLGLHIVKNLVQMHDGTVHVKSQVGNGTSVTVVLPLLKPVHRSTPNSPKHSMAASESGKLSAYVSTVRNTLKTGTFAIHGFTSSSSSLTKASLERYLTQWFEMSPVPRNSESQAPEIIIIDEEGFSDYLVQPGGVAAVFNLFEAKLVVVCDPTRRPQLFQHILKSEIAAEILTTPFGPHKLSRVLLASLETPIPTPTHTDTEERAGNSSDSFSTILPAVSNPHVQGLQAVEQDSPLESNIVALPLLPRKSPPAAVSTNTNPLRILCVDDNPINLHLLKTFLERLNYRDITCAINGSAAFEAVRQRIDGFELIFMDLSMPVLDGFSCTSMIRGLERLMQKFPTVQASPNANTEKTGVVKKALIVALTGLAAQKDQDAVRDAGADHFITKPLRLVQLKELMLEWGFGRAVKADE